MEAAPPPPSPYCTGERVVLLLYLCRILFSLTSPLLPHAFALCLVSFAALFAEISVEGSQHAARRFRTRPGASSGIFLGAITLPTVFFSRLIQMHRGVSAKDVGPEELEYLNMQYWAVIVSCFGVLLFLLHIRWQRFFDKNILWSWMSKDGKFSLVFSVSSAILLIVLGRYCSGLPFARKLLWITYYGLASVKLFNFIIFSFPNCASLGEVFLVTGGLVLFIGDLLAFTAYKLKLASFKILVAKSEISAIVQGMLFGLLLLPLLYKFILFVGNIFTQKPMSDTERDGMKDRSISQSAMFYSSFTAILIVSSLWIQFVQDLNVHPLQWVFYYVLTEKRRLLLSLYWISLIFVSVLKFYNISKHSKIERILLRKYYHLVAVLIFVPALLYEPGFLDLSFGAALAVFLVLETIRVWKIWPLGQHVDKFMNAFTDHRDSDILIVSHFSLLLGCALPKWLCSGFNDRPLAPYAGILSLGIGDTMASVVGYKYGVLRWSKTGKKTIEGTAAGISSVLLACSVLVPLFATTDFTISQHWLSLLVAGTISGLLEAYTAQLDNAFMPLVFYTLLCL